MVSIEDFLPIVPQENILYGFFLPLLLIFAILYGALLVVKLFNKRINFVLALIFTLLTTATPAFAWFSSVLPTYGAVLAVGAFAAIFIIGTIRWSWSKGRETYMTAKYAGGPRLDRIEKLHKALEKLNKEHEKALDQGRMDKAREILKQMKDIRDDIEIETKRRT